MSDQIVDGRRQDFYIVDNAIIDQYGPRIGVYGIAVYSLLARMAGGKESAFPSYQTIADKLGISRPKAISTVRDLIAAKLVIKTARTDNSGESTSNLYTLVDCGEVVNDIYHPVNDVNHSSKPDLPRVVNDVNPKNTNLKNTNLKKRGGTRASDSVKPQPSLQTQPPASTPQSPTNTFGTPLDDPRVMLEPLPDVRPRSQSKQREVNEGKANPGQLVKRGTGIDVYWIFREYFPRDLTFRQMELIREAVTDIPKWRAVCERWAEVYGNDWRKFGLLDWYRGEIPGEGGTRHEQRRRNGVHRANHQAGQRPHYANYVDTGYDEERANELNGWT